MTYENDEESISLNVVLNDNKATIDYDEVIDLRNGLNNIYLSVISEDATEMTYMIEVTKKTNPSSNKNIEVKINDEIVQFRNNKAVVQLNEGNVELTYVLEDKNAFTSLNENIQIKDNNNYVISFMVIAEDQSIDNYELELVFAKTSDQDSSFIMTSITFILFGAFGMKYYNKFRNREKRVKKSKKK